MAAPAIGIITGLEAEARLLRAGAAEGRWLVRCVGPGGPAQAAAAELLRHGARALISFGLAGGLDPALRPGAVVLASCAVLPDGREIAADAAWVERLRRRLLPEIDAAVAPIAGSDRAIASPGEKLALRRHGRVAAVDMETHGVALAAHAAGVPFLALRAVADAADHAVPEIALEGISPAGRTRPFAVLRAALLRPGQLRELARTARRAGAGLAALRRVAGLAGRDFALL